MASPLVTPFTSLTSSSYAARDFHFLSVHSTSSLSSVSSSRILCSAKLKVLTMIKASSLGKISPTPAAASRNISVSPLCSSKLGCPSESIRLHPSSKRFNFVIARTMADGESSSHSTNLNLEDIMDKATRYWDMLPPPIKSFPWDRALEDFFQIIVDLAVTVMKYLAAPMLLVTSVSEMSYCAGQRKLSWVPIPLVIGFTAAGVLKLTAEELYPFLKDTYVPWHLIAAGIFFTILKLPGPYYPFWGKIFIPHIANGGLIRIFWHVYSWYRNPQKNTES